MLIGEYQHSLDTKGRVNFPAKLREDLGESFILSKGLGDECLFVYSNEEWDKLTQKLNNLPLSKARALQRFLFAGATQVQPDKQGRILIPQNLRQYAKLQKDLVIVGASNRAEIWDQEKWEQMCGEVTSEMIAQTMDELDFYLCKFLHFYILVKLVKTLEAIRWNFSMCRCCCRSQ